MQVHNFADVGNCTISCWNAELVTETVAGEDVKMYRYSLRWRSSDADVEAYLKRLLQIFLHVDKCAITC